jgi:hypothetical protein
MSEELETITETEAEVTIEEPQGDTQTETDWKAEARKWEKRAKDAQTFKDAAEKWQEYEASLKPEHERLAEQLAAAKTEAESARVTLARYEVASEKGIPADAIKLLNGSTREELEEAADALLALIANQSKPKSPKPDMNQGKATTGGMTPAERFAAAIDDIL